MGGALWFFWLACGYLGEGRHYLDRALQRCPASGPVRSKGIWTSGVIAMGQGDSDTVARMAQEFRAGAEAAADPASLIAAAHLEGTHLLLRGKPAQAATVFDAVPYTQEHGGAYTGARFLAWMVRTYVHPPAGLGTRSRPRTEIICGLSPHCPGVVSRASGRRPPSLARWIFIVRQPRERPRASSGRCHAGRVRLPGTRGARFRAPAACW